MQTIHKSAAVVIRDNKFLMVRKFGKDIWTSLGGHIESGETAEQALIREIEEEFNCQSTIIRKLDDFKAKAAFDDAELVLSTFLVELKGEIDFIDPELEEYRFIDENYSEEGINLPDSIKDHVIPFCIKEGLLSWKI